MNSAQAKRIPLIAFLEAMHFKPVKIRGNEYWYKSPLREEQSASFTVNEKKNTWYDFGSGQGGNIIDLAGKIFDKNDISEILSLIEEQSNSFSFCQQKTFDIPEKQPEVEILKIALLTNPALLDYLAGRKVDGTTATQYCQEIHYRVSGKNYFTIGFKNDTGGYEIRNKYFKGCIKPKDITRIKGGYKLLTIFEGFMDFLSYQQLLKGIEYRRFIAGDCEKKLLNKIILQTDFLILNSIIHLKKATDEIKGYEKLHLFFDNDPTGKSCTAAIQKLGIPYDDISGYYRNHEDLNDYLVTGKQQTTTKLRQKPRYRALDICIQNILNKLFHNKILKTMKKLYFNLQSKGGVGKSFLTALLALKHEDNLQVYFVDLDSSVKTSSQQLKFLQGLTPPRFASMNLLDYRNKIDRQLLFENLHLLSQKDYEEFYLDFGAPESTEFPSLFGADYTIDEFKQIEQELNTKFILNIIIAGGSSYEACTNYLQHIVELVKNLIDINIYINESTFINKDKIKELTTYADLNPDAIKSVKLFGDFDNTTSPHKNILKKIEEGKGLDAYAFVERIKILKEIAKV